MESVVWYLPFMIFFARICDVSIGTIRTVVVISGHKYIAAALGFVEVVVWVFAVGSVVNNLKDPFVLIGYAGGFACGVLVGMWIEERIAMGYRIIQIISPTQDIEVAEALRDQGYRVTQVDGRGRSGPVEIAYLVVRRKVVAALREQIHTIDQDAFVTVERVDPPMLGNAPESRFSRRPVLRSFLMRK